MKKKTITLDNVSLHNKRLITLWQHDHFKSKNIKHLDGTFVCSNLFSVYVYTTNKDDSAIKLLAQRVDTKISDVLGELRAHIRSEQRKLHKLQSNTLISHFTAPEPVKINIDKDKISPTILSLVKIFIAIDNHIVETNQAKIDGDISTNECNAFQNHMFKQLNITLNELKIICTKFHKIRKNQ